MKSHIDAIKALLAPFGHPVHFAEAPETPTYPYILLWSSLGRLTADEFDGAQDDLNDLLGVTTVAATSDAALVAGARVRSYLLNKQPIVEGRHVQPLHLHDSQQVTPDTDVTMPNTNRHPSFAVDIYRLISEPA